MPDNGHLCLATSSKQHVDALAEFGADSFFNRRIMTILQTSLNLKELLSLFYKEVSDKIGIHGLAFSSLFNCHAFSTGRCEGHSYCYWLKANDQDLGELQLFIDKNALSSIEIIHLNKLVKTLIFPLRNSLQYTSILHMSYVDPITGITNHLYIEEVLRKALHDATYGDSCLTVFVLRLNIFCCTNLGAFQSEQLRARISREIEYKLTSSDYVFRYGSDQFLGVINRESGANISSISQELLKHLRNAVFFDEHSIGNDVSIGVATYTGKEATRDLIKQAKTSLNSAIKYGGNQVVFYS